jgi:hypothetical protein
MTFRPAPGTSRRVFLSASAVAAAAFPLVSGTAQAATGPKLRPQVPDPALRGLLRQIDPGRIQATITKLVSFGTRHTASSQTDPARGIGAATAYVTDQLQSFAAASNGRMTVQQQTFTQPVASNIPVPTQITNVIATLRGTASPERFSPMDSLRPGSPRPGRTSRTSTRTSGSRTASSSATC